MTREIKFRAFVNGEGKPRMIKWNNIDAIEWCNDKLWHHDGKYSLLGNLELMQFIGLKDKNGKEIYEGDIVNFAVKEKICPDCAKKEHSEELTYGVSRFCPNCGKTLTDADFITTSKVVFDKGGFAYEWSNKKSYYQSWQTHVAEIYLAWVEVVGNIYENSELLDTKKAQLSEQEDE